jgi:hypothetical protein
MASETFPRLVQRASGHFCFFIEDQGQPFQPTCDGTKPAPRRWDPDFCADPDTAEFTTSNVGVITPEKPRPGFFDEILQPPPGSRQRPQRRASPWRSNPHGNEPRPFLATARED